VDKLRDVVGLYLNPPEKAVVFCVDEKSGIQALDRTRPVFAMAQTGRLNNSEIRSRARRTQMIVVKLMNGRVAAPSP